MSEKETSKNIISEKKCKTCLWLAATPKDVKPAIGIGWCHRHAPTINGYPIAFADDWCGDHNFNKEAL
jgi:hypothetical protein